MRTYPYSSVLNTHVLKGVKPVTFEFIKNLYKESPEIDVSGFSNGK